MTPRRRSDAPLPRSPLDFVAPLTVRAPGAEGGVVLEEVRGELAFPVLRALRLVLAWCRGPEAAGAVLRPEPLDAWEAELRGARFDEGLRMPLIALLTELRRPAEARPEPVAEACFAVSDWALGEKVEGTALLFAEAAALAWSTNAHHAWLAGRMLRNAGHFREGERWLRRAARVAVWVEDWETQDLALNSLGNLYLQQGLLSEALEALNRALTLAQRWRLQDRKGPVTHDLFRVFVLTGDYSRAEELAVCAFELYGPNHPNLPKLAHDVVHLWLRQKRFPLALPVLRALLPFLPLPHERLRVLASTARAAGACGDRMAYNAAWTEAWELVYEPAADVREVLSAVLVDLGYGAASLSEWEDAVKALTLAIEVAQERGAHDDAAEAETALDAVVRYQRVETPRRPSSGPAVQLSDAFARLLEEAAQGEHDLVLAGGGAT